MLCIINGDLKMMKYLVNKGCKINQIDNQGNSELFYSLKSKDLIKFKYLVKIGCDISHKNFLNVI